MQFSPSSMRSWMTSVDRPEARGTLAVAPPMVACQRGSCSPGRASPIARAGDHRCHAQPTSPSPAVPPACSTVGRAGAAAGRERPECSGQPRGTPGIICPAHYPYLAVRRRPRPLADSLSHGGIQLQGRPRQWPPAAAEDGRRQPAKMIDTRSFRAEHYAARPGRILAEGVK